MRWQCGQVQSPLFVISEGQTMGGNAGCSPVAGPGSSFDYVRSRVGINNGDRLTNGRQASIRLDYETAAFISSAKPPLTASQGIRYSLPSAAPVSVRDVEPC